MGKKYQAKMAPPVNRLYIVEKYQAKKAPPDTRPKHWTFVTRPHEGLPTRLRVSSGHRAVSSQAHVKNRPDTNAKIQRQTLHPRGKAVTLNDSKKQQTSRFVRSYPARCTAS